MQLDLAMEKELSHDSGIEIVSSNPVRRGYAVIFLLVSCLGRQANVKQGPLKRSLRDQKKICPDSRSASTISVGLTSLKTSRSTVTRCSRIL